LTFTLNLILCLICSDLKYFLWNTFTPSGKKPSISYSALNSLEISASSRCAVFAAAAAAAATVSLYLINLLRYVFFGAYTSDQELVSS